MEICVMGIRREYAAALFCRTWQKKMQTAQIAARLCVQNENTGQENGLAHAECTRLW